MRLFGGIFQREVDESTLQYFRIHNQNLSAALGSDPLAGLDLSDPEAAVEALAVEYCRLFIGPGGHLPPVESVVLGEGRFWGKTTEKVTNFYRMESLALAQDSDNLPPDHLSVELDCIGMLEEDSKRETAMNFAREHPLRLVQVLGDHVQRNATLAFYPSWTIGLQDMLQELYGG